MIGYKMLNKLRCRDMEKIKDTCEALNLDGLVFIGGVQEMTEVAVLA